MGLCKVVKLANGRGVKFVHQLDGDGLPYAEDITVELQPGVEGRLAYLLDKVGQIGAASVSFVEYPGAGGGLSFPEDGDEWVSREPHPSHVEGAVCGICGAGPKAATR